jgi:hypothetical protein
MKYMEMLKTRKKAPIPTVKTDTSHFDSSVSTDGGSFSDNKPIKTATIPTDKTDRTTFNSFDSTYSGRFFDFNHVTLSAAPPSTTTCPAKCRRSELCYGRAYFQGKAGRGVECDPENCQWIEERKQ